MATPGLHACHRKTLWRSAKNILNFSCISAGLSLPGLDHAGDRTLEVVIMDFLGKPISFIMGQPLEMASSAETIRSTEVQGFKALESFRRQDRQGELNISVADRFWVKIDGEGLDHLEGLKAAAQQMDLKKLTTKNEKPKTKNGII
jgi:hypothetical protein